MNHNSIPWFHDSASVKRKILSLFLTHRCCMPSEDLKNIHYHLNKYTLFLLIKDLLNWLNMRVKTFIMSHKAVLLNFPLIKGFILKMYHGFYKKISSTSVFNINNTNILSRFQHIRLITEGSCDTEDWSENSALSLKWRKYILHENRK